MVAANSSVVLVLFIAIVVVIVVLIVAEDGNDGQGQSGIIGQKISSFGTRKANVSYSVTQEFHSSSPSYAAIAVSVAIPSSSFLSAKFLLMSLSSSFYASALDFDPF